MVKKILGIAAHPDDLEYGASGTVAHWIGDGAEVHYLICTDASKGSSDVNISSAELIETRRAEQRAACDILGVKSVTFLNYEDGVTEPTNELKRDIARVIRQVKPDIVVTTDPAELYNAERGFVNHTDHRAVGLAAMDAVYPLARDHLSFPELYAEGLEPHNVKELWFISMNSHNYVQDISKTWHTKLKALGAHASQVNMDEVGRWLEPYAKAMGSEIGAEYGEGFTRLKLFI